jgi:hypothetical protein
LRSIDSGYRVAWTPYARWIHFVNATLQRTVEVDKDLFDSRWQDKYQVDPLHFPGLYSRETSQREVY